jgi:mitogen-activated protein kinase kinase 9
LLIDYIQSGSLASLIANSSENAISLLTVLHIMSQIAQGLRYLNQYKIVHLDLKPENILLTKGLGVKIIDFGDSYNP